MKKYCFSNFNKIESDKSDRPININIKPTYSIQNILCSKRNKKEILVSQKEMNSSFKLFDIENFYLKFINQLFIKNEIHLPIFNSIKNIKFININLGFLVDIEVSSNVVLCNFQLIEKQFLKELRVILQNSFIKFNVIIKNNSYKIIFTRQDILKNMIIKNSLVLKLINELALVF